MTPFRAAVVTDVSGCFHHCSSVKRLWGDSSAQCGAAGPSLSGADEGLHRCPRWSLPCDQLGVGATELEGGDPEASSTADSGFQFLNPFTLPPARLSVPVVPVLGVVTTLHKYLLI